MRHKGRRKKSVADEIISLNFPDFNSYIDRTSLLKKSEIIFQDFEKTEVQLKKKKFDLQQFSARIDKTLERLLLY